MIERITLSAYTRFFSFVCVVFLHEMLPPVQSANPLSCPVSRLSLFIIPLRILLRVCRLLSYRSITSGKTFRSWELCAWSIGPRAEVWLEQIPGHVPPGAFLSTPPPIPTEFLGAPRRLQWRENGFSPDSAGASATCFILKCNMQERWATAALLWLQRRLSSLQSSTRLVLWAVCGRPPITDGIDVQALKRVYEAGEAVTLSCERGYTPSTSNPREMTCTDRGEWTPSDLACSRESNDNYTPPSGE